MLSTAAMVEGILSLISTNPQRDRDMLAMRKSNWWQDKSRKILPEDNSVLRSEYKNCDDDTIYNILTLFFISVKKILWANAEPNSVIIKTIGISVLFDVLKELLKQDSKINDFDIFISQISGVDYSNNYFQYSGVGKTRLRRVLKYRLGLSDVLKEDDGQFI